MTTKFSRNFKQFIRVASWSIGYATLLRILCCATVYAETKTVVQHVWGEIQLEDIAVCHQNTKSLKWECNGSLDNQTIVDEPTLKSALARQDCEGGIWASGGPVINGQQWDAYRCRHGLEAGGYDMVKRYKLITARTQFICRFGESTKCTTPYDGQDLRAEYEARVAEEKIKQAAAEKKAKADNERAAKVAAEKEAKAKAAEKKSSAKISTKEKNSIEDAFSKMEKQITEKDDNNLLDDKSTQSQDKVENLLDESTEL